MATTTDVSYDYFYYYVDTLFKRCQSDIIYQARNLRDNGGQSLIDRYVMTAGKDQKIFMKLLRSASADTYKSLITVTRQITGGYKFNEPAKDTVDTLEDSNAIMYFTHLDADYPADFTANVLDAEIEESIISGVLWRWWNMVGLKDMGSIEKENTDNLISKIKSSLNSRTVAVTRSHKML